MRLPRLAAVAIGALLLRPAGARAEGVALRADLVEAKSVKLDGVPKEWLGGMTALGYTLKGKNGKPDLDAHGLVAYDASNVYVAVDVLDDKLRGGADHVELVLGFPGGTVNAVDIFPGEPGKTAGSAKTKDGATVSGAKVVEAPNKSGWTLEAAIPWSTFPQAKTVRVGMRGALFVHDADSSSAIEAIVGTAPSPGYASLPSLQTESEQALADGLLKDKSIRGAPKCNLVADVAGDSMKERVLVYDHYLVVLGSSFRKGTEYFFSDLGVDVANGMLPLCEVRDVTGDGQAEIVLKKRFGAGPKYRELLQVMSFGTQDVPNAIFQHEVGISNETGSIANEVSFLPDGAKTAIKIEPGKATKLDAGNYKEPTETSVDPLLLPWGTIKSQTYKLSGSSFTKASEEKQAAVAAAPAAAAAAPAAPKPPPGPSASELLEKVYDLYKKDRGASGRPRFDIAVDVVADKQIERVLLHDRDIVVFGRGFKGGTGYAFLNLSQFAASSDITDLTARDLNGDGKAEILVRGLLHSPAPKDLGGGVVDREVFIAFQVTVDGIRRVFAAELGRTMGKKKVSGTLSFVANGKTVDIELAPGKAVDWTQKTYPFGQDTGPVGGFEPLLLPWGDVKPARYHWTPSGFSK